MAKIAWFGFALACALVACSSDDGVVDPDAGTTQHDASAPDASGKDAAQEAAPQKDATADVATSAPDASVDASVDVLADAPVDVSTTDALLGCTTSGDCQGGMFCDHGDNKKYTPNGQCTLVGTCKVKPTCNPNCISNGDTFCGCDGVTYYCPNCAEAAGTNVAWVNFQGMSSCP